MNRNVFSLRLFYVWRWKHVRSLYNTERESAATETIVQTSGVTDGGGRAAF